MIAVALFAVVGVMLGNARTTPLGLLALAVLLWRGVSW